MGLLEVVEERCVGWEIIVVYENSYNLTKLKICNKHQIGNDGTSDFIPSSCSLLRNVVKLVAAQLRMDNSC